MATSPVSSEMELDASPPRKQQKRSKKAPASRHTSHKGKGSSAGDKDALRRHKALERQCSKAQKSSDVSVAAETQPPPSPEPMPSVSERPRAQTSPPSPHPLIRSKGVSMSLPDVSVAGPSFGQRRRPEATFTPTAAGLRAPELPLPAPQLDFQTMFSTAFASMFAGMQQAAQLPLMQQPAQGPQGLSSSRPSPSQDRADSSEESDQAEEVPEDFEFSEDEGLAPDAPSFTGLFRPALFKSLLHKARMTTNLGIPGDSATPVATVAGPHDALFKASKPEQAFIPCPQLFADVLKTPWGQPTSSTMPSSQDKKLFCSAPELEDMLALPTIDPPVAALVSSSLTTTDPLDGLKPEDKKLEQALRKAHQTIAWTIRSATATSFFNRATLIWLRQLQERIPAEDKRLHQDVSKVLAATEYSADASLTSAKFASRALATSLSARRLLWLRHWRADLKAKWKLASAPYSAPTLFGAALDPLLIEDKDKRKVLPSTSRRQDRKFTPFSQRQSFRANPASGGSASQRFQPCAFDRYSERQQFRDRGRSHQPAKRPFRGSGYRPFRRGK